MNAHDDDLVIRSLASTDSEATEGAERRRARFQASLAAIDTDAGERARIDRIAAEAGITTQDEGTVAPGGTAVSSGVPHRPLRARRLALAEQRIAERTAIILLVRGENEEGSLIYAYVGIVGDRLEEFMAAQTSGTFYPEDFGVIIEAGEGDPTEQVRERMEREYAFNHDSMVVIPNAEAAYALIGNLPDSRPETDEP